MPFQRTDKNPLSYIKRVSLVFLAAVFIFSGCGEVFSNNPVVQNMKQGTEKVDLTMEDLNNLFDSYTDDLPPMAEAEDSFQAEKDLFYAFIDNVRASRFLQYEQVISYPDNEDNFKTDQGIFLDSDILMVTERGEDFVCTNPLNTKRVLHVQNETHLIDLEKATSSTYVPQQRDKQDFLYKLAQEALSVIMVDYEVIGNDEYIAFSVSEPDKLVKWYFTPSGELLFRIYKEDDQPKAVRYNGIDFNPEVAEDLFELAGSIRESSEDGSSVEESSSSEPESSQESSVSSASSDAPSVESSSSQASSVPSSTPQESSPESTSSLPDFSSKDESSVEPSPEPEGPKVPANYPHDQVPLIKGFSVTSSSDDSKTTKRIIRLSGTLTTNFLGTTTYYTNILSRASNFSSREMYDEESGYTYMLLYGTVEGWATSVEIAESHATSKCTMTITLKK